MEVFGIKFAPVNIPFRRRLQTLAAATWFVTFSVGGFLGLFLAIYLILFTSLWLPTLIYVLWSYFLDKDTCEQGGRIVPWVRGWTWWKYFTDYFPVKLHSVSSTKLDASRNYLFCCFPHGMLATGPFCCFGATNEKFSQLFPHHTSYCLTLSQHFVMPFFRELAFAMGGVAASAKSINWLMSSPGGGKLAVLLVGGAFESYNCKPGEYSIILKKRKGFVKLALKNGSPLVPVFSFGETDLYSQVSSSQGSILRKVQEAIRKIIGIAPVIPMGRGFFQYSFGIIPNRKSVDVVVGEPIDVVKNEQPTEKDIDDLHEKFTDALVKLFDSQKHLYLEEPEKGKLVIN